MNRWQRIIFSTIMVQLTAVLVLFHLLVDNYRALGIVKAAVIASIFVGSLLLRKRTTDHWALAVGIAGLFVGDFFLIFLGTLPGWSPDLLPVKIGGMIGFLGGYLSLLYAYSRRVTFGRRDALALVPVLLVVLPAGVWLIPYLHGALLVWALAFTFFLCVMAWSGICTIHRGYYREKVAWRFAIAGYLMFLSDMGVGFSFFYPGLHRNLPWLGTEIWITYIPAWTLILINLSEPRLTR